MNSDWPLRRIEEIAVRVGMGPFGSSIKVETFVETGVPIISGEHLHDITLTEGRFRYITSAHAEKLVKSNVFRGDVIFTHAGTIGQVSVIPENSRFEKYALSQRQFFLRCKRDIMNPLYVAYYFRSPEGRHKLLANASQVGVPSIARPVTYLRSIELPVPPIEVQDEIVSIVESLRDRIALLRETNANLEAVAQTLFKSWFVDFDPVRAKQEGRVPEGMDEATAALFPDSFDESVCGPVPKGWCATALADAFEINPKRQLKKSVSAPYLDMASLATSGHCVEQPIQRDMGSGAKFRNGDTLLARITPCLENGKSAFVDFLADDQIGWGSTEFLVLRPKTPLPEYFGYLLCRHPDFREYAIQSMSGTSGRQRVQNDVLGRYMLAVPDACVASAFAGFVELVQKSIKANHEMAHTLATLRDELLPQLISGRFRPSETKAVVKLAA